MKGIRRFTELTTVELAVVAAFFVGGSVLSVGFAIVYIGTQIVYAIEGIWP